MSMMTDCLAAAAQGAASVYHSVLATGVAVANLSATHPAVAGLLSDGVTYGNALLARYGVPPVVATVLEDDVLTALKSLAAHDATVPSV